MTISRMTGAILAGAMLLSAMPAMAQAKKDAMPAGDMKGHDMKAGHGAMMSEADRKKMAGCNAMSPADAARDTRCAELMKMHSETMRHMPAGKTM